MSRAPMPDSAHGETPMPSSFDQDLDFWDEGRWAKFTRRLKEEPLIPVGLGLTCYALYGATRSIRKGDKTRTNMYFRARVYAQAFTLLVLVVGSVYWKEDRAKRKQYEGLLGERKQAEKRDAWIKELEARDREDEIERQKRARRRAARAEGKSFEQFEQEEAQAEGHETRASSGMSDTDMRRLVLNSPILAPAMWIWKSRD